MFVVGLVAGLAMRTGPAEGESPCRGPEARVIGEAVDVDDDAVTFRVVSIARDEDSFNWHGWIVPGERFAVGYPLGDGDVLVVGSRYMVEISGDPPVESSVPDLHHDCLAVTLRPDGRLVHRPPMTVLDQVLRAVPVVVGAGLAIRAALRWRDRRELRRRSERAGAALAVGEPIPLPGLPGAEAPFAAVAHDATRDSTGIEATSGHDPGRDDGS